MIVADVLSAITTCIAALMISQNVIFLPVIYLLIAINAVTRVFHGPTFAASIPLLIKASQLARANSFIEFSQGGMRLISPVIGGVLLAIGLPVATILLLDGLSFFFAAVSLAVVVIPDDKKREEKSGEEKSVTSEAILGAKYLIKTKSVFYIMLVLALINLFGGGLSVLLPQMVTNTYKSGASLLGAVESVQGIGILVGSLILLFGGGPKNRVAGILGGLLFGAIFQISAGLSSFSTVFVGAIGLAVTSWIIVNTLLTTLIQETFSQRVLGRIFAFRGCVEQFTWPISSFLAGILAPALIQANLLLALGGLLSLISIVIVCCIPSVWLKQKNAGRGGAAQKEE